MTCLYNPGKIKDWIVLFGLARCSRRAIIAVTTSSAKDSRTALKIVDGKFIIGKEEYLPFAAEMHYFRVSKRYWSICFERIRKAGFRIISTAVPWNLHEINQGEFDFSGRTDQSRDLVVFLELAREFGFKIILKPGPWIWMQWKNGGIPDFVFRHPETAAKDKNGEPISAPSDAGTSGGLTPSYLHTRYQILLRHYYSVFSDVVKNYIYPRGPVFLIELDYEPSFCHNFDPYSGDYNEYVTQSLYPKFLDLRYESIEELNKAYKSKYKDFTGIEPPVEFTARKPEEYIVHADWVAFREYLVNRFCDSVADLLSTMEMSAMFSRAHAWSGRYHFPDLADAIDAERTIFTTNLSFDFPLQQMTDRARSVGGGGAFGFVSNFPVGHSSSDPEVGEQFRPVSDREVKRLLIASLASGVKGMNFNMFVGRDHWYGAALSPEGTIGPSYDVIRRFNARLAEIQFDTMRDNAKVALVRYRPYLRGIALGRRGPFAYLPDLAGHDFEMIGSELTSTGFDYRIQELTVPESLGNYNVLIVPLAEFMSAAAQTTLVELLKSGVGMIFYGLMPLLDERMHSCDILAKALGVRTTTEAKIYTIESNSGEFTARAYGHIRKFPSRAKKLAKSGTRNFGVSGKMGQTDWHFLTFGPGSAGNPIKGSFFSSMLNDHKLTTPVFSSDNRVMVTMHSNEKRGLLYIVESSALVAGEPSSRDTSDDARPVVIRADLAAVGIKAKRIKLVEFFSEQAIRVTPTELKNGISLQVRPGDSFLYYIDRG